jgi:septin family protein
MNKIIEFKKINNDKIIKEYELEDCDQELVELAEKLIRCNPSRIAGKKKETAKAEYLKKAREYGVGTSQPQELSEDDLDAAAGGLLHPEDIMKNPTE